jgi:hypoxanthine phosphoribosyltransferase
MRRPPPSRQNAPVADEREILTYELFGTAVRDLAQQVVDDGYEPDLILSIARGGLGLGMGLGYALDVKNLSAVNVEFYTGVDERLELPVMLPPTPDVVELAGLKVLIADDVADTGKTLEIVRDFCADHVAEARVAVIYEKPRTVIHPDYVWRRTESWIDFPWSAAPPLVRRRP